MKRVLNSGIINLPYVQGSEKDLLKQVSIFPEDSRIEMLYNSDILEKQFKFTFEIKAPLLVFQYFQNAHLGTLKLNDGVDHQTAYLPPSFYVDDPSGLIPMDPKSCNELNTKLNNFYNWSFNFYNKLVENGLCETQARLILPQGMFVTAIWEVTAKDLIAFIEQNCNKSPELFGYCSTLVLYLEDHLPKVASWLKRNKWKNLI